MCQILEPYKPDSSKMATDVISYIKKNQNLNMVFSEKKKIVYFKMAKVASSSIKQELVKTIPDLVSRTNKPIPDQTTFKVWINKINDDDFLKYFRFTFVRNPFDRAVSLYRYFFEMVKFNPELKKYKDKKLSFYEFLTNKELRTVKSIQFHEFPQSKVKFENKLLINFVGKFENINKDWEYVCNKVKIPYSKLPVTNATKHKHYSEYYNKETISIIEERYQQDLILFNYRFEKN